MTIAVTGATGQLGRLVLTSLRERGVPAADLVALARDTSRLDDWAEQGVQVRLADYDEPATLPDALAGVDTLLLISGSELGQRARQHPRHRRCRAAGVGLLAYTSVAEADTRRTRSPRSTAPPRRSWPPPESRTSCCATAGTSRTTPASCRPTSSTASSAPRATAG